jgi:uncharacterized protein (TIGR03790 family)
VYRHTQPNGYTPAMRTLSPLCGLLVGLLACEPDAPDAPGADSATEPMDSAEDSGAPLEPVAPTVLLPHAGFTAAELGIVVNTDDPLSAEIAAAYAAAHGVPAENVVSFSLGTYTDLTEEYFAVVQEQLNAQLPEQVQALLLTFNAPYRVSCMGAAAAFGLGFDARYCQDGPPCRTTAPSAYFEQETATPWQDLGVRPTMMLSAPTLADAQAIIDRGVASIDTFPGGDVWLYRTTDGARSTRYGDFERTANRFDPIDGLVVTYVDASADASVELLAGAQDVLGYQTGLTTVGSLDTLAFRPGALADHLTSFGGVLDGSAGQMPITDWLSAGATASYGTAIEPCNYEEKFPKASVLWSSYFRGASAVEAYWRSVEWPGEGNFVGDPLARPFGTRVSWEDGTLALDTTQLDRNTTYRLEAADAADGPWAVALDGIEGGRDHRRQQIALEGATRAYYRLVVVP